MIKANVRSELVLVRELEDVGLDLVPRRELVRPVGVSFERIRVEVGLHIARTAGIGVLAPCSANLACLFENDKRVDTGLFQLDGHTKAGEPGTYDRHLKVSLSL